MLELCAGRSTGSRQQKRSWCASSQGEKMPAHQRRQPVVIRDGTWPIRQLEAAHQKSIDSALQPRSLKRSRAWLPLAENHAVFPVGSISQELFDQVACPRHDFMEPGHSSVCHDHKARSSLLRADSRGLAGQ